MADYDFSNSENINDREFDVEERLFPNGRRIQAINRESYEYFDEEGTIKFAVRRTANADCGCSCRLIDMYFCYRCLQVVCHKHTAIVGCSVCQAPSFCWRCLVVLDEGENKYTPICLICLEEKNKPSIFKRIWQFLIHGKKNENALARRNP